jgi:beta-galactosidase/beta-glucuronidase
VQNGEKIGSTENMFHSHRFSVKKYLKEKSNELELHFRSPFLESRKEQAANGGERPLCGLRHLIVSFS